jgi:hypothetical protein
MYVPVETKKVPVARLIANLEREFEADPKDANVAWRLGRLYGLAYAEGIDSIDVVINQEDEWEYFGTWTGPMMHWNVIPPDNEERAKEAKEQLQKAIKWYEIARTLNPKDAMASLGYGWCLAQNGRKREARNIYREIINQEFGPGERQDLERGVYPPGKAVTGEALRYLIDLLNPVMDWNELRARRKQLEQVEQWPTAISPIAIPLGGERGIADIVRDDLDVSFDLDGSGRDQCWTWIDPTAAWLVHDLGDRGDIRSGRDLFGNVTFWVFWNNGYEALAALDDNGDGYLRDDELRGLKLWNDRDSNGVCHDSELRALGECGITALSCTCSVIEHQGRSMWVSRDGVLFSDGSRRTSYDVVLRPRPAAVASATRYRLFRTAGPWRDNRR